eukprot:TRINITY_DN899_c1_g1_i6.p1 TRINITY_DN899_c1_g1~~TRINITY_DN899_c1_g1_i6.p1  ORF type:complete len:110 (-),score=12.81 TRINITY_DN899_c1_g1_i6:155-442(-)
MDVVPAPRLRRLSRLWRLSVSLGCAQCSALQQQACACVRFGRFHIRPSGRAPAALAHAPRAQRIARPRVPPAAVGLLLSTEAARCAPLFARRNRC